MVYPNLWWLQWWKAVFQPVICSHILDGLFDRFGKETILGDDYDVRNYDDVGQLINNYQYSDASDNKRYSIKPE